MTIDTSKSLLGLLSQESSDDSWQLFVAIYRPFILRCIMARQVRSSDLDDLCQETLTHVFRGVRGFEHNGRPGAFRSWLVTIISQRVWNYFRNSERQDQVNQAARQAATLGFDAFHNELDLQWQQEHDRHLVNKMLELVRSEFSTSSWQAFRLIVLEGLSAAEAAEQLSISVNAVLIAKSRVMRRLKQFGEGMVQYLDLTEPHGTS